MRDTGRSAHSPVWGHPQPMGMVTLLVFVTDSGLQLTSPSALSFSKHTLPGHPTLDCGCRRRARGCGEWASRSCLKNAPWPMAEDPVVVCVNDEGEAREEAEPRDRGLVLKCVDGPGRDTVLIVSTGKD